jgi:hypothetical protein
MSALFFRLHRRPPLFSGQILGDKESMPEHKPGNAPRQALPTINSTFYDGPRALS